jgi:hypothetical protein
VFADLVAMGDRIVREHLGDLITYAPSVGDPVSVRGIFDASHVLVDVGEIGVSSVGPAVFLRLSDLPSDPETDIAATVIVGAVTYVIREVKPDSLGGVHLLLNRS